MKIQDKASAMIKLYAHLMLCTEHGKLINKWENKWHKYCHAPHIFDLAERQQSPVLISLFCFFFLIFTCDAMLARYMS